MRKALLAGALFLTSVVLTVGKPQTKVQKVAQVSGAAENPAQYQEMLNKYCITCHNEKARIPAGAPLALDKANLKDPGEDAVVWEKVVRKLGVGAMPPQGSPSPGPEELKRFRS